MSQLDLLARLSAQSGRLVEAEALCRRALYLEPQNQRFSWALHYLERAHRPRVFWLRMLPWVHAGACGLAVMGHLRAQRLSLRAELHTSRLVQQQGLGENVTALQERQVQLANQLEDLMKREAQTAHER